jgi:hypothetical protein
VVFIYIFHKIVSPSIKEISLKISPPGDIVRGKDKTGKSSGADLTSSLKTLLKKMTQKKKKDFKW